MATKPLKDKEIIELLARLSEETPEYPPELMRSRKAGFFKRVDELKASGGGEGGDHSRYKSSGNSLLGGSGGSGAALGGGGSATTTFSTKSALVVGLIVVLLTLAYLFRNQIIDFLAENEIIPVQETAVPSLVSMADQPTETPTASPPSPFDFAAGFRYAGRRRARRRRCDRRGPARERG